MKSCVSLYSYWKPVRLGEMDQYEVIEKIKALGVDAVELLMLADAVPKGETMQSYAKKLYGHARKTGLEVPILSMDSKLYCADPEKELSYLCSMVDVASECGIGLMRFDIAYSLMGNEEVKNYKTVINAVTPYIRRLADYAKGKGVKVISENHGRIIQDSYRIEELVTTVDHRNYGYLCDIGNFGGVDEDCASAVSRLLPYITFVHAKDALVRSGMEYDPGRNFSKTRGGNYRRATIFGQGDVPVYRILSSLKAFGYDGYISLEYEGIEDTDMAMEIGAENLKRMLSDIEK
jgi:sugar phosphate isomerase/epimerase